ncbi:hypothetical protein BVRB_7g169530 [Beta vulgaris subsp. vulgaris]|nr:hypothetical protein BVRB_7g169530 [Beta vulgaris subsp. vulgaris]
MSFLDNLWDETLAGPAPKNGVGSLRKYKSLSAVRSPNHPIVTTNYHDDHNDQTVGITRSITILRTKNLSVDPGSPASSPTPSSGPSSPFSPGGMGNDQNVKKFTRKKPAFEASKYDEATSPTVYDWIMISALDR